MRKFLAVLLILVAIVVIAGAWVYFSSQEEATVPIEQTYGPNPHASRAKSDMAANGSRGRGNALAYRHDADGGRGIHCK